MSDRHNRRDFLKTSALAALGSAATLGLAGKKSCRACRGPPCHAPDFS